MRRVVVIEGCDHGFVDPGFEETVNISEEIEFFGSATVADLKKCLNWYNDDDIVMIKYGFWFEPYHTPDLTDVTVMIEQPDGSWKKEED